jgi:hypothetical protein
VGDGQLLAPYHTDGDGTAKVNANVHCNGFTGASSAWFDLLQLERFSEQLLAYPLPPDGVGPLQGGFWSKTQSGDLAQLQLSIKFYPVGLRGVVACKVILRTPLNDGDNTKVSSSVEVELRSSYQELSEFSNSLKQLSRGEAAEAILRGATT